MRMRLNPRRALAPEDVLRHPQDWQEISWQEARAMPRRVPIVVVTSREDSSSARWDDSSGPATVQVSETERQRYYRYAGVLPIIVAAHRWNAVPEDRHDSAAGNGDPDAPGGAREVAPAREETKTWIKFRVVDDATGQPITGVELDIDLPSGEGALQKNDGDGVIEIDGIEPGSCAVRCSLDGAHLADTLAFVTMGEKTGTPEAGETENVDDDADAEDGDYGGAENDKSVAESESVRTTSTKRPERRIALIDAHKVKTGETLAGLAKAQGLSWQALAEFNWDTSDPDEINKRLRDDVGCTRKTKDGDNYVFADEDDPGIVWLPKEWEQDGLATGKLHTIRVRHIAPVRQMTIVYLVDPAEAAEFEGPYPRFILRSTDSAYKKTRTPADDLVPGDGFLQLVFDDLMPGKKYTLRCVHNCEHTETLFAELPFEHIVDQYREAADLLEGGAFTGLKDLPAREIDWDTRLEETEKPDASEEAA